ncbi:MAG: phosphodiester glycosidase family protein [Clostridiaceae bacterium]|nr:phosphodiester glycosidase family protein [Clostridiaceae bacterium]
MKNRILHLVILFTISITVLWILCPAIARKISAEDGHNSYNGQTTKAPNTSPTPEPEPCATPTPEPKPLYKYYSITENKPDFNLSMHVLEIDPSNPELVFRPVMSHKTLFGYELLSVMYDTWQAKVAVNAGFSHSNGMLGGLFAMEGELFTAATGNYPVLFLDKVNAYIEDVSTKVWVEGDGISLDNLFYNRYSKEEGIYVFTPSYGTMNRLDVSHLNAVISNGEVRGLILRNKSYEIPKDGFLISAIGKKAKDELEKLVKPGMRLQLKYDILKGESSITGYDWAYECGSWILKDHEIIVPDSDGWVGTMKTRVPRTAVGVKEDGTVVFVVVDGRQKGLSDGLTGKELGQRLLDLGVKDAVNLDGGASSEMIVEGNIVNSPSAGRERMLPCGFIIK